MNPMPMLHNLRELTDPNFFRAYDSNVNGLIAITIVSLLMVGIPPLIALVLGLREQRKTVHQGSVHPIGSQADHDHGRIAA